MPPVDDLIHVLITDPLRARKINADLLKDEAALRIDMEQYLNRLLKSRKRGSERLEDDYTWFANHLPNLNFPNLNLKSLYLHPSIFHSEFGHFCDPVISRSLLASTPPVIWRRPVAQPLPDSNSISSRPYTQSRLENLADELLLNIVRFIPLRDLSETCVTCKATNRREKPGI